MAVNKYCNGGRESVGNYGTLAECIAAVKADANNVGCSGGVVNGLHFFDYNPTYGPQCKCATDTTCSTGSYGSANGYRVYTTTTLPCGMTHRSLNWIIFARILIFDKVASEFFFNWSFSCKFGFDS